MDIRNATPKFRHFAIVYSDSLERDKSYSAKLDRVNNLSVDQRILLDYNFIENLNVVECYMTRSTVHHLTLKEFNDLPNDLTFDRVLRL